MKRLSLLFLLLPSIVYSQTVPNKSDSAKLDSLMIIMEKLIKDWNPKNEPWNFIKIELEEIGLTINYGQQAIHPFLAEYNRRIQFITENSNTDTLDMAINTGGRTMIEVYYNQEKELIVMEDHFGGYYFDKVNMKYSERLYEDFKKGDDKVYLGSINGKEYPLKFVKDK